VDAQISILISLLSPTMLEDEGVKAIITPAVVYQVATVAIGFLITISIAGFMMFTFWKVYAVYFEDESKACKSEGEKIIDNRDMSSSTPMGQRMKRD